MVDWLLSYSYLGFTIVLILTGCGLPLPEEVPIILAGVASSQPNSLDPALAFAACLVGALLGDCMIYLIGYHFGHNLVRRHPRFAQLLHADREADVERVVRQHAFKVLILARFLVGIRAPVYLAAGVVRMPFRRFILIDTVCASAVVGAFFGLAYWFGDTVGAWIRRGEILLTVVVVLVVAVVIAISWVKGGKLLKKIGAAEAVKANEEPVGKA